MGKVEFGIGYLTTSARASPTRTVKKNAPSENRLASFICLSPLSRLAAAGGFDVLGGHRTPVRIAQKRSQIIHPPRHLGLAPHRPPTRASALPVYPDRAPVKADPEGGFCRQRAIGSGTARG